MSTQVTHATRQLPRVLPNHDPTTRHSTLAKSFSKASLPTIPSRKLQLWPFQPMQINGLTSLKWPYVNSETLCTSLLILVKFGKLGIFGPPFKKHALLCKWRAFRKTNTLLRMSSFVFFPDRIINESKFSRRAWTIWWTMVYQWDLNNFHRLLIEALCQTTGHLQHLQTYLWKHAGN